MRAQNVGHGVRHPLWIARILDRSGQPVGPLQASLGRGQKHDAAIRGDASAIKRSCDLLARNGWNESGSNVSSVMAGEAPRDVVAGLA